MASSMAPPFRVTVVVRGYELDTQGHLNQAVYLNYAEHARWEVLRAAGISQDALLASGVGPVALETTIRFQRELRGGDEVAVSCEFEWGAGKTFRMVQHFDRGGERAAEVVALCGFLDLTARRLIAEPGKHLRSLASRPELLGV